MTCAACGHQAPARKVIGFESWLRRMFDKPARVQCAHTYRDDEFDGEHWCLCSSMSHAYN